MSAQAWILIAVIVAVLLVVLVAGTMLYRRRRISLTQAPPTAGELDRSGNYQAQGGFSFSQGSSAGTIDRTDTEGQPRVGDDAAVPRDAPKRGITEVRLPEPTDTPTRPDSRTDVPTRPDDDTDTPTESTSTDAPTRPDTPTRPDSPTLTDLPVVPSEAAPDTSAPEVVVPDTAETASAPPAIEEIAPTEGRLERLRGRLSRSQSAVGKSLLGLLGGGDLDEDSWEEVEDTLLLADLGTPTTTAVVSTLREQMAARSVRTEAQARALLREVLVEHLHPEFDRSVRALPHGNRPSILLVVGVNGTGKTTTTGKLARVLVADGRRVLLGAADTFRAAAADQLQTWGERVGADTVRGREGADPASVAFDAVSKGVETGVDAVLVDTAGRLHTKTGLMDELGKVKRVVEKALNAGSDAKQSVDEVLLVLDATIGQNGLMQARVFADVVDITGVVLTKLDGTAKGGIVFKVQHELGVPVKLVGLGEGADDLAPFEPGAFVDALLG